MKQRLIPLLLAGLLALGGAACSQTQADPTSTPTASPVPEAQPTPTPPAAMDKEELRVGFLYPGDQSDQGYTRNLAAGAAELAQDLELEEGQILERYNVGTEEDPAQAGPGPGGPGVPDCLFHQRRFPGGDDSGCGGAPGGAVLPDRRRGAGGDGSRGGKPALLLPGRP